MADDDQPSAFAPVELQAGQRAAPVSWLRASPGFVVAPALTSALFAAFSHGSAGFMNDWLRQALPVAYLLTLVFFVPVFGFLRASGRLNVWTWMGAVLLLALALAVVTLALGGNAWGAALLVGTIAFTGWLIGWLAGLRRRAA